LSGGLDRLKKLQGDQIVEGEGEGAGEAETDRFLVRD